MSALEAQKRNWKFISENKNHFKSPNWARECDLYVWQVVYAVPQFCCQYVVAWVSHRKWATTAQYAFNPFFIFAACTRCAKKMKWKNKLSSPGVCSVLQMAIIAMELTRIVLNCCWHHYSFDNDVSINASASCNNEWNKKRHCASQVQSFDLTITMISKLNLSLFVTWCLRFTNINFIQTIFTQHFTPEIGNIALYSPVYM